MNILYPQLHKQSQTMRYGKTTIEYDLVRSKRVKTSEIIVDENKILVRTPFNKSQFEINRLLEGKAKWILDKQREYREHQKKINKPTFQLESTLPYLGRNYRLIFNNDFGDKLIFAKGKFIAPTKYSPVQIKSLYQEWLYNRAKQLFSEKVRKYSKELDIQIEKIVIKNLRNRWGSVTRERVINLNLQLLKAPERIIDYIIIHELCHILVKGHSYRFWSNVSKVIPDYKKSVSWLDMNASSLIE